MQASRAVARGSVVSVLESGGGSGGGLAFERLHSRGQRESNHVQKG